MTGMLNDMLAREHVRDLLCEAEDHRSGARARTKPRGLGGVSPASSGAGVEAALRARIRARTVDDAPHTPPFYARRR